MTDHSDILAEVIKEAEKKALRLLTVSDRTEYQLREKLREGDFPPEAIDAAVEYVRSYHYIDDGRYAEIFIRSKRSEKSIYEIRMELTAGPVRLLELQPGGRGVGGRRATRCAIPRSGTLLPPAQGRPQRGHSGDGEGPFDEGFTWPIPIDATDADGQHWTLECEYTDGGGFYGYA